jgi:hypothetical protein
MNKNVNNKSKSYKIISKQKIISLMHRLIFRWIWLNFMAQYLDFPALLQFSHTFVFTSTFFVYSSVLNFILFLRINLTHLVNIAHSKQIKRYHFQSLCSTNTRLLENDAILRLLLTIVVILFCAVWLHVVGLFYIIFYVLQITSTNYWNILPVHFS